MPVSFPLASQQKPRSLRPGSLLLGLAVLTIIGASLASASHLRRTAIVIAVEQARPSVVNIHGRKTIRNDAPATTQDSFRQVNGMGTGVVIDERGYILTNFHVVEGVARIQVTLHDDRTVIAQLIAHDPKTDLAIIKVDVPEKMTVIRAGTSCDLMPAEPVIAIGNAYGYPTTVTRGIISALHRSVQVSDSQEYHDLIQTDASINPGNSGGPLLNIDGEMIGINVAVRVGAQGIGFAIPVDEALEVAAKLMSSKQMANVSHGVLGKTVNEPEDQRFVVSSVVHNSAAERAGIRPGDVIVHVGDLAVKRSLDLERAFLGKRPGDELEIKVKRSGDTNALRLAIDTASQPTEATNSVAQRAWDVLGLKLSAVAASELQNSRYRGGLKVTAVRPESPAAKEGIHKGDVLVGMHKWETISIDNVSYILGSNEFASAQPVKFYIYRGGETLYGHLRVSMNSTR